MWMQADHEISENKAEDWLAKAGLACVLTDQNLFIGGQHMGLGGNLFTCLKPLVSDKLKKPVIMKQSL